MATYYCITESHRTATAATHIANQPKKYNPSEMKKIYLCTDCAKVRNSVVQSKFRAVPLTNVTK